MLSYCHRAWWHYPQLSCPWPLSRDINFYLVDIMAGPRHHGFRRPMTASSRHVIPVSLGSRATPVFGSVRAISSFLLQNIPRHPQTHLFEVQEAFKPSSLLVFQAYVRAYMAIFSPPADLRPPPVEGLHAYLHAYGTQHAPQACYVARNRPNH